VFVSGSRDILLIFVLAYMAIFIESNVCSVFSAFDAAFAKLLWPRSYKCSLNSNVLPWFWFVPISQLAEKVICEKTTPCGFRGLE